MCFVNVPLQFDISIFRVRKKQQQRSQNFFENDLLKITAIINLENKNDSYTRSEIVANLVGRKTFSTIWFASKFVRRKISHLFLLSLDHCSRLLPGLLRNSM